MPLRDIGRGLGQDRAVGRLKFVPLPSGLEIGVAELPALVVAPQPSQKAFTLL